MSEDSHAWEAWELTARLDSGHWVFARFLVTNAGPGKHNCIVLGHVVEPDGTTHRFKNGRRRSEWQLSANRRRLDVGSSHLHLDADHHRLWIDKQSLKIDLEYTPLRSAVVPQQVTPEGLSFHLLDPGAVVRGSILLPEMANPLQTEGRIAAVHTMSDTAEQDLLLYKTEFFSLQDPAIYALHLAGPRGAEGAWMVESSEEVGLRALLGSVSLSGTAADLDDDKYWVPGSIDLDGPHLEGRLRLGKPMLSHDPKGILPWALRLFLPTDTRPFKVWAPTDFQVRLPAGPDRASLPVQGTGVTASSFLNPVAQPD